MSRVINVKQKCLNELGYQTFQEWKMDSNHVYIGRNMSFYVRDANASKWQNPFSVKKFGRDKCIDLYKQYIRDNKELYEQLDELENKELGCWCHPQKCHGDILIELLKEKKQKKN